MNTKAQELALREIMQGLEEFATFMSYQSDYDGLRIISVETTQQARERERAERDKARVVDFQSKQQQRRQTTAVSKQLRFFDRQIH